MEICFIPDNDYAGFIRKKCNREIKQGNYVDTNGNILGIHKGIINYTVGQRKGLNLSMGHPVFVKEIRSESNEVVIGENDDIMNSKVEAVNVNYMGEAFVNEDKIYTAKIRYNHKGTHCCVKTEGDRLICIFDERVRAAAPGQALVVYDNDYIAFGGTILKGLNC